MIQYQQQYYKEAFMDTEKLDSLVLDAQMAIDSYNADRGISLLNSALGMFESRQALGRYHVLTRALLNTSVENKTLFSRGEKKDVIKDAYEKLLRYYCVQFDGFLNADINYQDESDYEIVNGICCTVYSVFMNACSMFCNWANNNPFAGWGIVLIQVKKIEKRYGGFLAKLSSIFVEMLERFRFSNNDKVESIKTMKNTIKKYGKYM